MSGLQAIADRFEIEAVRGEFTDAAMMGESDRFTSLFTQDGAWRIPDINEKFVSRGKTRAGIEWLQGASATRSSGCPTATSRMSPPCCAMRCTTSRRSNGEASICSGGGSRDA